MTGEAEALRDAPRSVREFFESVAESPDWLNLTNPRVKRWGSNMWESHSGSHHTPATIKIQIVIKDDDLTGRPVRMAQPYRGVGGAAPASSRRGVLSGHSA